MLLPLESLPCSQVRALQTAGLLDERTNIKLLREKYARYIDCIDDMSLIIMDCAVLCRHVNYLMKHMLELQAGYVSLDARYCRGATPPPIL